MKMFKTLLMIFISAIFVTINADDQLITFDRPYPVHHYGILAGSEWLCEKPCYSGNKLYKHIYGGISGKCLTNFEGRSKYNLIHFEFMHCKSKLTFSNRKTALTDAYIQEFLKKYSDCVGTGPIGGVIGEGFQFEEQGENYAIKRTYGWRKWSGICEIYLLYAQNDVYIMISCIDLRMTRDPATLDELFEQMRALVISLD